MGARGTFPMTPDRQKLIEGLEKVGGSIKARGKEQLRPEEVMETLGFTGKTPTAWNAFLNGAQKAGIIKRTVHGRRSKAIYLVHGTPQEKIPTNGTKHTKKKAAVVLPLPALGSTLTVFDLNLGEDGKLTVALRNEMGSWAMEVEGYAANA